MIVQPIIFLDVDGVLNSQLHYESKQYTNYLNFGDKTSDIEYNKSQISEEKILMLNGLCEEINAIVVISASMRNQYSVEELQEIFNYCGATFTIIDKTGFTGFERGTEISQWLKKNITLEKHGCYYFDFNKYVIIDDDSDMLLTQQYNFFQTDTYIGLTPTICYKIKRFITNKTFDN